MNIAQRLLDVLAEAPDQTAIIETGGRRISRGQLRARVLSRARCLISAGLSPGDPVIIQAPPGIELVTSALATLVAGGVLVLAEAGMVLDVYKQRIASVNAAWFVVDRKLYWIHLIPGLSTFLRRRGIPLPPPVDPRQATRLVTPLSGEKNNPAEFEVVERTELSDAVIVFTGGTTLDPKGVRLSHRSLKAYLSAIKTLTAPHAIERFVADNPQQILYGLYLGVCVWVPMGRGDKRVEAIAQCLFRDDAEMFFGSPSTWAHILRLAQNNSTPAPSNLRLVILGGAPVSNQLLKQLERWLPATTEIRVLYGLTEVGPACSCTSSSRLRWQGQGNLVGTPLPDIQLSISSPGTDGVGELEIRGPAVFSGYLNHDPSAGVLKTGDLAKLVEFDDETHLVLLGRKKDMIIRRGVNIYPPSVEPVYQQVSDKLGKPLFIECALVGLWDASNEDEHLVLFYMPMSGLPIEQAFLRERILVLVGSELLPDTYIAIDQLPTVGRDQEIDKLKLRTQAAATLGLSAELPLVPESESDLVRETLA